MTVIIRCPSSRQRWLPSLRSTRLDRRPARRWSLARLVRGAVIVATTIVVALAAALFVTVHAVSAKPDEWTIPIRFGLLGVVSTLDAGVTSRTSCRLQPAAES